MGARVGVGKASINLCEICTSQDIISLTEIDSRINKIFLLEVFRYFENYFNSQKRGATIKGITSSMIKERNIPIPPMELQNNFSDQIEHIETIKSKIQKNKAKFDNLFNSLLQQAFKGELEFNDKAFKELKKEVMN